MVGQNSLERFRHTAAFTKPRVCRRENNLERAAVIVQKHRRGLVQRRAFLGSMRSVVSLQASVRGWLQRKHLRLTRAAALVFQSLWRGTNFLPLATLVEIIWSPLLCLLIWHIRPSILDQDQKVGFRKCKLPSWYGCKRICWPWSRWESASTAMTKCRAAGAYPVEQAKAGCHNDSELLEGPCGPARVSSPRQTDTFVTILPALVSVSKFLITRV